MQTKRLLRAILVLALSIPVALAQGNSSLQGTVVDPSGAVIPGTTIEITNVATQATMTTTSNDVGAYRFPQVTPGTYNMRATSEGLVAVGIPNIQLLVNQPVTVDVNFTEVGSVSEIVSVEATTAQINTVDASLGNAVGSRPIIQLPFEARNVVGLLSLQPGVVYTRDPAPVFTDDTRKGAVNGGKSDQANITLDGVDVNDQQSGTAFSSVLRMTLDSVQEFRTTTLNAGADQGRSSGAQVALVTKSGTNDLHGSAYYYLRHDKTAANNFFNNAVPSSPSNPGGGIERQKLRRNVYGGSIGGPIKKNRIFFFYNYEGRKDRSEQSVVRTVPSETLRQGTVRYITPDGGVNALSPDDIRNVIDPLGIGPSANALATMNLYPLPNDDTVGDGLNTRGYRFKSPIELNWNTHITRWDFYLDSSAKHQVFFRGNYQDDNQTAAEQFPGMGPINKTLNGSKGLAIGYNTTISPTMYNTFRYGYTRQKVDRAGSNAFNQVQFRGLDDLVSSAGGARSLIRILPVHTFRNDFSWIKGNHAIKAGGVFRLVSNARNSLVNSFNRGVLNASWLIGSGAELNNPIDDTLAGNFRTAYRDAMTNALGLVTQGDAQYNFNKDGSVLANGAPVIRNFQQRQYEFYVMDTWRVTRGLTITAGLRYGLNPPVFEANGVQTSALPSLGAWFDSRNALMQQGRSQKEAGEVSFVLKDDPKGRDLYPYHKKNFAPRIAIAYSPQTSDGILGKLFGGPGKTSIRAGFGVFYDNFGQGLMRLGDSTALGLSTQLTNPSFSLGVADAPRFTATDQIPDQILEPAPPGGFPQVAPNVFAITNSVDDTIKPPYSMALNFSIGRELPQNFFLEVSYVGRLSRRSLIQRDLAMPADITDPNSGQTYFQAAKQLANLSKNGTAIEDVQPIAYWEHMFPGAAGDGLTATQNIYDLYDAVAPDYTFGLFLLDRVGFPSFSKLGDHAFFNEQFSALSAWSSIGRGDYHAGQVTLRKRWSQGFQFDLNYTYSKSLDLASNAERVGSFDGFLVNSWSPNQLKAVSDYDTRHQVNAFWVAELPFGRGKHWGSGWNAFAENILGGWQISGLWRMTSGLPAQGVFNGRQWPTNWNVSGFATQTGPTPEQGIFKDAQAVAGTPGPNLFSAPGTAVNSWSPSDPGESGQRNGVRGDGYFTLDFGIMKRFQMPFEGHSVQFRWEIFNVTNSVRFDPYNTSLGLSDLGSFGKYQDTSTNPRVMQFALRYEF